MREKIEVPERVMAGLRMLLAAGVPTPVRNAYVLGALRALGAPDTWRIDHDTGSVRPADKAT